jgi:hypothetical protein
MITRQPWLPANRNDYKTALAANQNDYKAVALPLKLRRRVPLVGLEPTTSRLEGGCAIQLRQRGLPNP